MMHVRAFTESDLAGALALSSQAGWNQIEADWRRLLRLWPETCLVGCDAANPQQVLATATVACYGTIGWVGMVLVEASQRGRGIGGMIFQAALQHAGTLGITVLGLDATDMGRPVYLKQGFVDRCPMVRMIGPATDTGEYETRPVQPGDWQTLLLMDQQACGVNRAALLRGLSEEADATVRVVEKAGQLQGFGFSRSGRTASMIGPIVTGDATIARRLAMALISDRYHHAPLSPVLLDALETSCPALPGMTVQRRLMRMSQPATENRLLDGSWIYAAAGFELG